MMHMLQWEVTLLVLHLKITIQLLIIGLLKMSLIFVDSQKENLSLRHFIQSKDLLAN